MYAVRKLFGPDMMPDAPDDVIKFLEEVRRRGRMRARPPMNDVRVCAQETDRSARRNGFIMLFNCAPERAVGYLVDKLDSVSDVDRDSKRGFGEGFQLIALELARKCCRANPAMKPKFMRFMFALLQVRARVAVCVPACGHVWLFECAVAC